MADFTKKAIRNSFVKLLNEKPLKQISVRDIVDDCGVNRNTFYYYFQDIPHLVETIIKDDADRIIMEHPKITSIEDCLEAIIGFALTNRKAVLHIYRSVNRDVYEQYQWRVCEHAVTVYIDEILIGKTVSEFDRKVLIEYVKCVCFGLVISWLEKGMTEDIQAFAHRICELKQGDLEAMIERCQETAAC